MSRDRHDYRYYHAFGDSLCQDASCPCKCRCHHPDREHGHHTFYCPLAKQPSPVAQALLAASLGAS